jgi:peptidoglycan/LPS O-acetylase OafA/YrhL
MRDAPALVAAPTSTAQAKATHWLEGVEVGRLLAMLAVVWIHACDMWTPAGFDPKALGSFGVPFFTMTSVWLVVSQVVRKPELSLFALASQKFRRILLPFLVASALYLGLELLKAALISSAQRPRLGFELFILGSHTAYWFMPFLFTANLIAVACARLVARRPALFLPLLSLSLVSALLMAITESPLAALGLPGFASLAWWSNGPALWIGIAWAMLQLRQLAPALRRVSAGLALGCALGAALLLALAATTDAFPLQQHAAALLALIACVALPSSNFVRRVQRYGAIVFFVYLSHPVILWPFYAVARRISAVDGWFVAFTAVSTFAIALALGLVLRRYRLTRFLVP